MIMFVGMLPAGGLAAEGNSSLSESKIENAEQKITAEPQNEDLRKQLSIQQESLKTLTASLAESNAEAEVFRRKYSDLEFRMEVLGLASASKDRAKLEQRLLAAVSDLRVTQKERDDFRDQLLGLNEVLLRYLQTSQGGDAQARMVVCGCEHWRAAGRENWNAAASNARRSKDRDAARGGRTPANLRRGD